MNFALTSFFYVISIFCFSSIYLTSEAAEIVNPFPKDNVDYKIAVRAGIDSTRYNIRRSYTTMGIEALAVNNNWGGSVNPEAGFKLTNSIPGIGPNYVNSVTNLYGFIGANTGHLGYIGDLRLLLGGEWIDIDKKIPYENQFAVGAEARVGYEWDKWGVFASYAITEHLQMIGVDVGIYL